MARERPDLPAHREAETEVHLIRALVCLATGDRVAAIAAFEYRRRLLEDLVARYPEYAGDRYRLAWQLANCPIESLRDPERALELAQQSWSANPDAAYTLLALGTAQFRCGKFEAAMGTLERLLDGPPDESCIARFVLAMAYHHFGQSERATQTFRDGTARMHQHRPAEPTARFIHAEAVQLLGVG